MAILAVALFGSQARGDQDLSSDVDILLITNEGAARHASMGNLSLSFYPLPDLHERARSGDLFLCHVLREGRPLYDPDGCLPTLASEFSLRATYAEEIQHAADLAWFMVRFGRQYPDSDLFRRRIAWCVRTILIGRSAEDSVPVFAPRALAKLGPQPVTGRLIAQKNALHLRPDTLSELEAFLYSCLLPDPLPTGRSSADFGRRFVETDNSVAQNFFECAAHADNCSVSYA